jgi:hypothetical protein
MTALGVFRDDFYNAVSALAQAQSVINTQGTGTVLAATTIGGAADCYFVNSGSAGAVALTTDSAVNIIAQVQNAVATAYKQGLGSFAAGVNPPPGVPNLFNFDWTLTIVNNNTAAGAITIGNGAGVSFTGSNVVAIATAVVYQVTVTSPTTVTFTRVCSFTAGA